MNDTHETAIAEKLCILSTLLSSGINDLKDEVHELCRQNRTLRWRLAEVQKLVDESDERNGYHVIKASRATMHFILTGSLPDDIDAGRGEASETVEGTVLAHSGTGGV